MSYHHVFITSFLIFPTYLKWSHPYVPVCIPIWKVLKRSLFNRKYVKKLYSNFAKKFGFFVKDAYTITILRILIFPSLSF